ncbi:uncharacterized protein LOC128682175 [Plodia interpunctella]|uniref:uncharacterized protein LOC128682175 n=1 Tax=Plodia interpunctella TaxID=58824 RepID=UPI002367DC28|nr:uncharacterized protein LOC128682175 [Plodia interpunctella]
MERLLILICIQVVYSSHSTQSEARKDVIITYAGHVDAVNHPTTNTPTTTTTQTITTEKTTTTEPVATTTEEEYLTDVITETATETTEIIPTVEEATFQFPVDEEEVIFVPNNKEPHRIEDVENEFYNKHINIGDLVSKTAVADVIKKTTTEPVHEDILFISGKNAEPLEEKKSATGRVSEMHVDTRREGNEKPKNKKLDCTNLICTNKLDSVCGGKKENHEWRYRLFLNECFFRKVNCNFNHEENRYKQVLKERCHNVGAHLLMRPRLVPHLPSPSPPTENLNLKRRSFSSRRATNLDIHGRFCSHPCPSSCPDDYDPECAVSKRGEMKVFVNHCKLDLNSCFYGEFWHLRPLSECVGGKKADMRQNRAFIAWMQKAGMINNKGKLML